MQNPTKPSNEQALRIKTEDDTARSRRGFRVAHRTAAQQLTWLLNRAERHGFTIPATTTPPGIDTGTTTDTEGTSIPAPAVSITARDTLRFRKSNNGPHVTLSTATFQGRLRITDTAALRTTLLTGIGPAKGYGQGLLTLAPLPDEAPHG